MNDVVAFRGIVRRDKYENLSDNYYELLWAVSSKYENETRHQTALRYIKQAEAKEENCGASVVKKEDE